MIDIQNYYHCTTIPFFIFYIWFLFTYIIITVIYHMGFHTALWYAYKSMLSQATWSPCCPRVLIITQAKGRDQKPALVHKAWTLPKNKEWSRYPLSFLPARPYEGGLLDREPRGSVYLGGLPFSNSIATSSTKARPGICKSAGSALVGVVMGVAFMIARKGLDQFGRWSSPRWSTLNVLYTNHIWNKVARHFCWWEGSARPLIDHAQNWAGSAQKVTTWNIAKYSA